MRKQDKRVRGQWDVNSSVGQRSNCPPNHERRLSQTITIFYIRAIIVYIFTTSRFERGVAGALLGVCEARRRRRRVWRRQRRGAALGRPCRRGKQRVRRVRIRLQATRRERRHDGGAGALLERHGENGRHSIVGLIAVHGCFSEIFVLSLPPSYC